MKLGMIGAGRIARFHLEAFSAVEGVQVTAISNRTKEKAQVLADEFSISNVYDNSNDLLASDVDAVCILTSVETIYPITMKALAAGKHCLIEKPPGLSVEEAREIEGVANENNLHVMVALNRRFMSTMKKAKELIKEEQLKTIIIEAPERFQKAKDSPKYSQQALDTWIYANGIHCLDLFTFFAGKHGKVVNMSTKHDYHGIIEFTSGTIGHYYANYDCPGNWSVILVTDKRKIILLPLEKGVSLNANKEEEHFELDKTDQKFKPGFLLQAEAFVEGVAQGRIVFPACSIAEAVTTMELIAALDST